MGRGIKEIVIGERDRFILFLLNKFRVLDSKSLVVLAGFPSVQTADIRLRKLASYGYIKREKIASEFPIIHWLTSRGHEEITGEKKHILKPKLATLEHEILVGQVAGYLFLKHGVEPSELITDRDLRVSQGKGQDNRFMERKADLLYKSNYQRIFVEVELNFKGEGRTLGNVRKNRSLSDHQIWFVSHKKRKLAELLNKNGVEVNYLEDIDLLDVDRVPLYRFETVLDWVSVSSDTRNKEEGILDWRTNY